MQTLQNKLTRLNTESIARVFKKSRFAVGILSIPFLLCCTSEDVKISSECYKVRIGYDYCRTRIIYFDKPNNHTTTILDNQGNPLSYAAAVVGFPDSLINKYSELYVTFHYDKEREKEMNQGLCEASFIKVKVLVLDNISKESCNEIRN